MVGGVAHEINNPLMGILNYVEYAKDKATDPKSQEVLGNALHEIHRIKKIVSNMLVFIHPNDTQLETCNAQEVVTRTLALLEGQLKNGAIQIQVDIASNLPPLQCDAGSLEQVLVNLLLNARDALSCQAEQRISIEGRHEQGQVLLSICDNGPGIPESLQNKVFDPFFTTKPVGKGTGLGLSVSRQLLEAAGGTISHYSANGYGCCFRVACTAVSKPE
jgi:C4-dicarboxylate-specific signal transduction histidine kinase